MLMIPSVSASSCILPVETAEAGVDARDDQARIGHRVATQHVRHGGRVLVRGDVRDHAVVVEAVVADHHVGELAARRLMAGDGHAFLDLGQLRAEIDRALGQILQRLADAQLLGATCFPKLMALQHVSFHFCHHILTSATDPPPPLL